MALAVVNLTQYNLVTQTSEDHRTLLLRLAVLVMLTLLILTLVLLGRRRWLRAS